MKITIYELLGLIKDGKAPKFIKYLGDEYEYVYKDTIQGSYDYKDEYGHYLLVELLKNKYLSDVLKVEVEIIEEEKDIEELNYHLFWNSSYELSEKNYQENGKRVTEHLQDISDKIDELVREVNKLKGVKND